MSDAREYAVFLAAGLAHTPRRIDDHTVVTWAYNQGEACGIALTEVIARYRDNPACNFPISVVVVTAGPNIPQMRTVGQAALGQYWTAILPSQTVA